MKYCPLCNKKYHDDDFYCLVDRYRLKQIPEDELTQAQKDYEQKREELHHTPRVDVEKHIPTCLICKSTNLSKLSNLKKVGKISTFGIFGMGDNGKVWKCNDCGAKF